MHLYRLLDRVFPNSYPAKVFFVAFVGTHIPLIAIVGFVVARPETLGSSLNVLGIVLAATLVGCAGTLAGIWALLAPIRMTHRTLLAMEAQTTVTELPSAHDDALGHLMRMTNRMVRITDRRLAMARDEANVDPLTRLLNRRGFDASVPRSAPGALIYMDIDHFKRINDTLGHDRGDKVLQDTARVIAQSLREEDVVARYGGEEFVVWLPGVTLEDAAEMAERIRRNVAETVEAETLPVTVSLGVDGEETPEELPIEDRVKRADAALYQAKSTGRNKACLARDVALPSTHAAEDADFGAQSAPA